jgi:hypothetical protein
LKTKLILLVFLFLRLPTFGQSDSSKFFTQVNISINKVYNADQTSNNPMGFGTGLYLTELKDKLIKIRFGIEYNRINYFNAYQYESHFSHLEDITYHFNYFSIPLTAQLNIGSKIKAIIETGIYLDVNFSASINATGYYSGPNSSMTQLVESKEEISQKADILPPQFGYSFGIGIKIPIWKYLLIITPDYKGKFTKENSSSEIHFDNIVRLTAGFQWKQ